MSIRLTDNALACQATRTLQRMKRELPMAAINALGQAGCARCIESCRLRVLVEIGKVEMGRSGRQQLLVFADES
jgi:formate hydrogenlyase subunit 6/NADH:ubiquinone oxidoreductase subunit I